MRIIFQILLVTSSLLLLNACGDQEPKTEDVAKQEPHNYEHLAKTIDSIGRTTPGRVGVAVINLNTGDSFSYNGYQQFPMFSTYKFPLALYVLNQVEAGKLSLNQEMTISRKEMEIYNPGKFGELHKKGDVTITVDSMIYYAMSYSDNITTDNLFKLVGGPAPVNAFIQNKGVSEMNILNTVLEMNAGDLYKANTCKPMAMSRLLQRFQQGEIVSNEHRHYLLKYMETAPSGPKRIKGLLPEGTVVAHKTGTGGTNKEGITEGANDVGIVSLPNGQQLALSVYIAEVKGELTAAEAAIARIARAVYDDALLDTSAH